MQATECTGTHDDLRQMAQNKKNSVLLVEN